MKKNNYYKCSKNNIKYIFCRLEIDSVSEYENRLPITFTPVIHEIHFRHSSNILVIFSSNRSTIYFLTSSMISFDFSSSANYIDFITFSQSFIHPDYFTSNILLRKRWKGLSTQTFREKNSDLNYKPKL